jgi:hypothetical protein
MLAAAWYIVCIVATHQVICHTPCRFFYLTSYHFMSCTLQLP